MAGSDEYTFSTAQKSINISHKVYGMLFKVFLRKLVPTCSADIW